MQLSFLQPVLPSARQWLPQGRAAALRRCIVSSRSCLLLLPESSLLVNACSGGPPGLLGLGFQTGPPRGLPRASPGPPLKMFSQHPFRVRPEGQHFERGMHMQEGVDMQEVTSEGPTLQAHLGSCLPDLMGPQELIP